MEQYKYPTITDPEQMHPIKGTVAIPQEVRYSFEMTRELFYQLVEKYKIRVEEDDKTRLPELTWEIYYNIALNPDYDYGHYNTGYWVEYEYWREGGVCHGRDYYTNEPYVDSWKSGVTTYRDKLLTAIQKIAKLEFENFRKGNDCIIPWISKTVEVESDKPPYLKIEVKGAKQIKYNV